MPEVTYRVPPHISCPNFGNILTNRLPPSRSCSTLIHSLHFSQGPFALKKGKKKVLQHTPLTGPLVFHYPQEVVESPSQPGSSCSAAPRSPLQTLPITHELFLSPSPPASTLPYLQASGGSSGCQVPSPALTPVSPSGLSLTSVQQIRLRCKKST